MTNSDRGCGPYEHPEAFIPTGTVVDGLISITPDEESILGDIPEGVYVAPRLGVDFVKPWVIYRGLEKD